MSLLERVQGFVFPGQGSQKVGMGLGWVERSTAARETFAEADDALGFAISELCWQGPEDELGLTANTQPALLATSIAIHRALMASAEVEWNPVAMAGHSLGEYSALVAAGALDFSDALRLVRKRGELMQEAVPVGVGGMAAVIGLEGDVLAQVAAAAVDGFPEEVCAIANLNAPGQTVLAGHRTAIERAAEIAKTRGARKVSILAVSAPFHSPLMRPAREKMAEHLAAVAFHEPRVPVISNVDAVPVTSGEQARDALVRQIDGSVRWVESVRWMAEHLGVGLFLEIGPGSVLSGLVRRIAEGVRAVHLPEPEQLDKFLAEARESAGEA